MNTTNILKRLPVNTKGNDYVVGDIHGMFSMLYEKLDEIGYNADVDRLICVGDLIDRGLESKHVVDFLDRPDVHSVLGNHEQMCIDAYNSVDEYSTDAFYMNGGGWWENTTQVEKNVIAYSLMSLPLAIEVELKCGRGIGVVHADVPYSDWNEIRGLQDTNDFDRAEKLKNILLWDRSRINNKHTHVVKNIDMVYVGHTPQESIVTLGNVVYIDTGACFRNGRIEVVDVGHRFD